MPIEINEELLKTAIAEAKTAVQPGQANYPAREKMFADAVYCYPADTYAMYFYAGVLYAAKVAEATAE